VFGMGTGGTPPTLPPETLNDSCIRRVETILLPRSSCHSLGPGVTLGSALGASTLYSNPSTLPALPVVLLKD
jgi:hypothetical protein